MKFKDLSIAGSSPGPTSPRDPRVHRQTGISSILCPRRPSKVDQPPQDLESSSTSKKKKKLSFQMLSANDDISTSKRRFASTPQLLPSNIRAQIDIKNDKIARGLASGSPPIVDFTRFEDTYRGPNNRNFEGLVARRSREKTRDGLRNSGVGERLGVKTDSSTSSSVGSAHTLSIAGLGPSPYLASERKADPRLLMSSLQDILGSSQRIETYLDKHSLLCAHQLDQLDFEERDAYKASLAERGNVDVKGHKVSLAVFGESIRKASIHSSTNMLLGGREHELPIIVVNCVEELYRTGIYQPNLFRALPNRSRLMELINIFDSEGQPPGSIIRSPEQLSSKAILEGGFGSNTSLHLESTPDICALLTTYISSLPEPILTPNIFYAIWDWCGCAKDDEDGYEDEQDNEKPFNPNSTRTQRVQGRLSSLPMVRTYTGPVESTHILIAQLLLHLLPSPNFSLFVYLLAFFSQVMLVRDENGVGMEDLGRMFGRQVFGAEELDADPTFDIPQPGDHLTAQGKVGSKAAPHPHPNLEPSLPNVEGEFNLHIFGPKVEHPRPARGGSPRTGDKMMCWFLRRWGPISEGLFDVVDDAQMGLFKRPLARKDSFGRDILPSWPSNLPDQDDGGRAFSVSRLDDGTPGTVAGIGLDTTSAGISPLSENGEEAAGTGFGLGAVARDQTAKSERTKRVPIPRISKSVGGLPQGHSTPKPSSLRTILDLQEQEDDIVGHVEDFDYVLTSPPAPVAREFPGVNDDTLDISQLQERSVSSADSADFYSALHPSLNERLLDVSMPAMLDQATPGTSNFFQFQSQNQRHLQTYPSSAIQSEVDSGTQQTEPSLDHGSCGIRSPEQYQLSRALALIAHLEKQLQERTESLTNALSDLARSKLELESTQREYQFWKMELEMEGQGVVGL